MSRLAEVQVWSSVAFLALGVVVLAWPWRFFRDADREWSFIERFRRYGGQPSLRTPEWERSRKVWHVLFMLLGVPLVAGGLFGLATVLASGHDQNERFAAFDELEVGACTLGRLEITNRASANRAIEIGPLRAVNGAVHNRDWGGRPVAVSLEALGAGVVASQIDVVATTSSFTLAPGERREILLDAAAGTCRPLASDATRGCGDLVFRLKAPGLNVLRSCPLR